MRAPGGIFTGLALLLLGTGCREAALSLAPTPASVAQPTDLVSALGARFGPIEREPSFDALRPRLARAALVPSRVFDDRTAWTRAEDEERAVEFHGRPEEDGYRIGIRADAPPPGRPGTYRGTLRLRRLGDGRFDWRVREELSIGGVRVQELAAALTALLRGAEEVDETEARRSIHRSLPRATEAFGRLVALETLRFAPAADRAVAVTIGLRLRPEGLDEAAPRYAAYLRRYAAPVRLRAVASDGAGLRWWTLDLRDNLAILRFRVHAGDLAPLEAPARPIPDRLTVRVDYSTKAGLFRVGVKSLEADVALVREADEKAFTARFVRAPDWRLPFVIEPFLRGSLRFPFEGAGSFLTYAVRDRPGSTTLLVREYRLGVRESWIVRWLGGLSTAAVDDFRRGAEAEADRFTGEAMTALRDDLRALLSEGTGPGGTSPAPEGPR
ncbi:MAG TPA: hypothetical protein VGB42_08690 [Candidatus Thermoplasmatota archaeon]